MKKLTALFLLGFSTLALANPYDACIGCHGENGEGGVGPVLQGQSAEQIKSKLLAYQSGKQMGPMTSMMAPMTLGLTNEDLDELAAYISKM